MKEPGITVSASRYWEREYRKIAAPPMSPTVTGFNVNLDRTIPVTQKLMGMPVLQSGGYAELRSRLIRSMELCTAEEWFVPDPARYRHYTETFSGEGSLALGGQAGIAALHLARLGVQDVFCIAPSIGPRASRLLMEQGVKVPGSGPDDRSAQDAVHLIFEYEPGIIPAKEGVVPRSNRFIASPQKTAGNTLFPEDSLHTAIAGIGRCTRAFLSGYQYLKTEEEFIRAAGQLRAIGRVNGEMRVHIECVSVSDPEVNKGIVQHILAEADSAGMNEHELSLLLGHPAGPDPEDLVRGMLELAEKTGLARIHLHTFGYYLQLIRADCSTAHGSRTTLMYAARVVSGAAGGSGTGVIPEGIEAVERIAGIFGSSNTPGISSVGEYHLLVIPTLIATGIRRTVGLGDILSSTAFVVERFR